MARSFGERFLEGFQRAGGSTAGWPSSGVAALKRADRRAFIDALGKVSAESAKSLLIAAHTAEPETLGRRAAAQERARDAGNFSLEMLSFIVMS